MCGIVGVIDKSGKTDETCIRSMSSVLAHRGPDDSGLYKGGGAFLAHRRLSLIDLTASGHQPMETEDWVIVYNGEIYNYRELRVELEQAGLSFHGNSDTEVLLRGWEMQGEKFIDKCCGMFAFALLKKGTGELFLYRDRLGVKPVYYFYNNEIFAFASELKSLLAHPQVSTEINNDAVGLFLQLGYIPAPYSIYKNIYKLEPAHRLHLDEEFQVSKKRYWDWRNYFQASPNESVDNLDDLETKLTEACDLRMIADVPVGVFLSGGIDSSLVTALLVKQGHKNVSTFTIGFGEASHNEADHAKAVAKHLGTKHHEHYCTSEEAQEIIPKLSSIYDEPFADASAIPTYLLSKFAKKRITAALSADGGDELFGGYTRYRSADNIVSKFSKLPNGLGGLIHVAASILIKAAKLGFLPKRYIHKFSKVSLYYGAKNDIVATYAIQNSYFSDSEIKKLLLLKSETTVTDVYKINFAEIVKNVVRKLQVVDTHSYLPDNILVKVDRASMAVSLEAREPLLDHVLWEEVAKMSGEAMHYQEGVKYPLRQILYKYVPRKLVDRPKQGFGVPLNEWLRGDLRYLLDEHLSEENVKQAGLLNFAEVEKEKSDFLKGLQPYNRVWNLLILHMWYKECLA